MMEATRLGKTKIIAVLKREQIKRGVIFPGGDIPEDLEMITPKTSRKESSSFLLNDDKKNSFIFRNIAEEERILDSESEDQDPEDDLDQDHDHDSDGQGVKVIVSYVD